MANVLLIEDDDAQRLVASFALKKAGHQVQEAADGRKGVLAAMSQRPDVVVCDVMMPGMSGYEVVSAIRGSPALATVPVILLTAMSDRKHMRQGMTAGADDYLTKPYRPDELIEAISVVLERRQKQQEAFMSSVSGVVEDALEQQKETLGKAYEKQLVSAINERWNRANAAVDISYGKAVVVLADLMGPAAQGDAASLAEMVKQVQQSARDTLYLFGARHVLPYGPNLMAVFDGDEATMTSPVEARALRAAAALAKGGRDRVATVAVHCGPVMLVAMHDGLHGDQGHALAPGDTIAAVTSVLDTAIQSGWRIGTTPVMAQRLSDAAASGRRAVTARGEEAVELLSAKA